MKNLKYLAIISLFLFALSSLYETGLINSISLRSFCRDVYIPAAFWVVVMLYSVLLHIVYFAGFGSISGMLKSGVILGFSVNIYMMMFDLVLSLTKGHPFLSEYYFCYIKTILLICTFCVAFAAVFMLEKFRHIGSEAARFRFIFFVPLSLCPVYFIAKSFGHLDKVTLFLIAASYVIPYLFLMNHVVSKIIDKLNGIRPYLSNDRNFVMLIFMLAFIMRCVFAFNIIHKTEVGGRDRFILASDDGQTYDRMTAAIISKEAGVRGAVKIWGGYWEEGYVVFLYMLYNILGRNFYVVTIAQSLLGALLPVAIFFLGKLFFSRWVGVFGALALALKESMIFLAVVLGHEAVWMPLLSIFILLLSLCYTQKPHRYRNALLAGAILGVICALRNLFLYFLPFLFLWILFLWVKDTIVNRLRVLTVISIALILAISSISVVFKAPLKSGDKERISIIWGYERLHDNFKGIGNARLKEIGVDLANIPMSLRSIAKDPARFIAVALAVYPARVIAYFETYQFGFFDPIYLINSANWPNNFMSTLEFYFTLFFIYGLVLSFRRSLIWRSPIFLILAFNIFIYAIIFCNMAPRFKDASTPFVYLIGSYGFVGILKQLKILKN